MTILATLQDAIRHMAEAARSAWWKDKLFRGAVIGMGVTLGVIMVRPGSSQDRYLPPLETTSSGVFAVPGAPGRSNTPPIQTRPPEIPTIAPGHALGDVTLTPALDGDRFGTLKPGTHP